MLKTLDTILQWILNQLQDYKWQTLTLASEYTGSIKYRKRGFIIEVDAYASHSAGSGFVTVATLPTGYRPAETKYFSGYGGVYSINPNGAIQMSGTQASVIFTITFIVD